MSVNENHNGCIIFGVTKEYIFAVGNILIGMGLNKVSIFNTVLIVVDNINDINKSEYDAIKKIARRFNFRVLFISLTDLIPSNLDLNSGGLKKFVSVYTAMPLVKLFAPLFLKNNPHIKAVDSILWLDCDICVLKNFDDIVKGGNVCACLGSKISGALKFKEHFPYVTGNEIKPNGGVLLYKKEAFEFINFQDYFKDLEKILIQLSEDENILIEEVALTLLLKKWNITIDILCQEYNHGFFRIGKKQPILFHSVGKKKFWNDLILNVHCPQWERYNIEWLNFLLESGLPPSQIQQFNKSKFTLNSYWLLQDIHDWRVFWSKVFVKMQFSDASVWFDGNSDRSYIQFFVKSINRRSCHFEIQYDKKTKTFTVSFHLEKDPLICSKFVEDANLLLVGSKYSVIEKEDFFSICKDAIVDVSSVSAVLTNLIQLVNKLLNMC